MKCKITFKVECSTTINKIMTIYYNIVVIKMEKYLDNLREKPTPNIKQKDGLRVFFMERDMISPEIDESLVERDEEGNLCRFLGARTLGLYPQPVSRPCISSPFQWSGRGATRLAR